MKVFISWSGDLSHEVAKLLHEWIPTVLQSARPWISSHNIPAGSVWFSEILSELSDTALGILCLTLENRNSPWILFEAGALVKGLNQGRVCPVLIDLESLTLSPPLSQLNCVKPDTVGLWRLIEMLNESNSPALPSGTLRKTYDALFPSFSKRLEEILQSHGPSESKVERTDHDLLVEAVTILREMQRPNSTTSVATGPLEISTTKFNIPATTGGSTKEVVTHLWPINLAAEWATERGSLSSVNTLLAKLTAPFEEVLQSYQPIDFSKGVISTTAVAADTRATPLKPETEDAPRPKRSRKKAALKRSV